MATTQTQTTTGEFGGVSQSDNRENNQTAGAGESVKKMANEALSQIKEKTADVLDEQKSGLTGGIKDVAGSIRQVAENLSGADEPTSVGKMTAQYGTDFARRLDKFSSYLENANLKDFAREVEGLARRQPALFIAGAFAVGLLAARFLKTSHPLENFSVSLKKENSENGAKDKNFSEPQPSVQTF